MDTVEDGSTGLLIPPEALAGGLRGVIEAPALSSRLGERARRLFAWDGIAARHLGPYGALVR